MMSLVAPRLFSAFKGEYPVFLSGINFKILHANCVPNQPSTVFYSLNKNLGIHKWIKTKKC